jgi:hypothetical protein
MNKESEYEDEDIRNVRRIGNSSHENMLQFIRGTIMTVIGKV